MLEALWTANFVSNHCVYGGGAVVFETGRIFGGDSQYYYVGNYEVSNGCISGDLEVTHFAGATESIFGSAVKFSLHVEGGLPDPHSITPVVNLTGCVVDQPDLQIYIELTKRADLPS